LNIISAYAP
jgi:hypothetical protein